MSGFPNRPSRAAFGPTYEDEIPVQDPKRELGADTVNLSMWQVAGAGRTLPMALVLYDPNTESILYQTLAFDPRQELGDISIVRDNAGQYTMTFEATYQDQRGSDIEFLPKFAIAFCQWSTLPGSRVSANAKVNGLDVEIEVLDSNPGYVDPDAIVVAVW